MRDEAIDALVAVRDELARPVEEAGDGVSAERRRVATLVVAHDHRAHRRARPAPGLDGPDRGRLCARARRDRPRRRRRASSARSRGASAARCFEHVLSRKAPEPTRPSELVRIEREITLGTTSAGHLHTRLLPLLREAASARLGIDFDLHPERARAALGDESWELLRPDRPEPARPQRAGPAATARPRGRRRRWSSSDGAAGGARPRRRRARRGRARDRRQARGARADPRRDALRRARAARGLPRPREDAGRALVRAGDVASASRASSSRPT